MLTAHVSFFIHCISLEAETKKAVFVFPEVMLRQFAVGFHFTGMNSRMKILHERIIHTHTDLVMIY